MKTLSKATFAVVLCLATTAPAQTPPFRWAVAAGGNSGGGLTAATRGLAVDPAGNLLVAGIIFANTSFGTNLLLDTPPGTANAFLAKYDSNGVVLKAILPNFGSNGNTGLSVAVDGTGNTYALGNGSGDGFLAKYDTNLNPLWVTNSVGGIVFAYGIAADTNGNCFVSGNLVGAVSFGNITVYGPEPVQSSSGDVFLAKYDTTGNCLWAEDIGVSGTGSGIVVDSATNVLVTSGLWLGGSFIAKYDPNGNNLWFQQRADITSFTRTLATDPSANVYVTGAFSGDITFGSSTLSSSNTALFVGKYDSNGNPLWALQSSGAVADGQEIVVDASGNSFIAGAGSTGAIFGAAALATTDLFLAKVSSDGHWRWVKEPGGNGSAQSYALALSPSGRLYFGGYIRSSQVNFDSAQLKTPGLFVAELDAQPPSPALTVTNSTSGGLTLIWPAFPNGLYRAQYKSALDAPNWTDLAPDVAATSNSASFTDSAGPDNQRYYRIAILP